MTKEAKFIIGAFLITAVLTVGVAYLLSKSSQETSTQLANREIFGIKLTPENIDLGEVPLKGGIVAKEYEVENTTDKTIELKKIATSCMCTTASVKVGDKESRSFGMEMAGDKNPFIAYEIPAGGKAKVTVNFDPAAHGPEGVGPFDRIVWLYFEDGFKELTFNGEVIN